MTPFERQPHAVTLTVAIVAVALVALVLASTLVRRAESTAYATNVADDGNGDRRCGGGEQQQRHSTVSGERS